MKYEFSNTYTLIQDGKNFTTEDKIKINRYSNKTERIVFKFDGSIPSYLKLFVCWKNPRTNAIFYEPILYDVDSEEYYVIIGSSISFYDGKWGLTICGVEQDYDIGDNSTIDETLIFWVSNPFQKIVVIQGLINEDSVELSYPNIEKEIIDLQVLHGNVVDLTLETIDLEKKCENILSENNDIKSDCQSILSECQSILDQMKEIENRIKQEYSIFNSQYDYLSQQLERKYEEYASSLMNLGGGD